MPSGDGLLARIKPFGGRLSSAMLWALADAVEAYGNGVVELTSRGNLQVRGVRDVAAFAGAMVRAGLADADPERELRRNVVAVPPCDDALVAEAEAVLAETAGLHPKFFVVVRDAIYVGDEVVASGPELRRVLARPLTPTLSQRERAFAPSPSGRGLGEGGRATYLYPRFGQTNPEALRTLAALNTEIRTTPWRAFLSPSPAPGFDTTPTPITACAGAPACSSASVPARADAAALLTKGMTNIHISGCAKLCGAPSGARLVGDAGRYTLTRPGQPDRPGLTLDQAAALL